MPTNPTLESAALLLRQIRPDITAERLATWLKQLDQPAAAPAPGRLLSPREAATRLSCSTRQVYVLLAAGTLPRRKLGNRSTRIPESAIIALASGQ